MINEPHIWMRMPDYLEVKRESGEPLTKTELSLKMLSEASYALELVYQIWTEFLSEIESGVEDVADRDFISLMMDDLYDMADKSLPEHFAWWRIAPVGKQAVTVELIIRREKQNNAG